jgi:hypothetical protein
MTIQEAIRRVFQKKGEVLTIPQVKQRLQQVQPNSWAGGSISAHLASLSANRPGRGHPNLRKNAFLFSLGNGRYRLWDPQTDATRTGPGDEPRLADEAASESEDLNEEDRLVESGSLEASITLERDMEATLIGGLNQLEQGLVLYSKDGLQGQQFDTGVVGRLDLLAIDKDGQHVVIELKVGRADDRAVAQTMRYMGWVQRELAGGKPVRGILIAREFSEGAKFAALALPTLTLKEYRVAFTFDTVDIGATSAAAGK